MKIITGFHAIEEEFRFIKANNTQSKDKPKLLFSSPTGPRVKKIQDLAKTLNISMVETTIKELSELVKQLPSTSQDHRGVILVYENVEQPTTLHFDDFLKLFKTKESALVLVLDSITDPHNVGAIVRSADQFGVDLVLIPQSRSATDSGVIARTSSGASSWVPILIVPNLVRAVEQLKESGFWVYGADLGTDSSYSTSFTKKTVLVLGSEGTGISRLLKNKCDTIVSIPTQGKLDSLNVSVAAGILLYEIRRK